MSGKEMTRRVKENRGVALMVVLTGIAVLTAFSTEFAYRSRVDIKVASNLEKRVQAYFHARSAMEIVRLVLTSQKFVDQATKAFGGGIGGRNFELWRFACKFAEIFSNASLNILGLDLASLKDQPGIGVGQGGFYCKIEPEDARVNLNASGNVNERRSMFTKLYALLKGQVDPDYNGGDDRKAMELILNIMDWTDPDNDRTELDSNGNFILGSGGDENAGYSKFRYKAKNAKMDTVDEALLVEGMTDDIFCKLRDNFTVYNTEKININEAHPLLIRSLVCNNLMVADPNYVCGLRAGLEPAPIDVAMGLMEVCRRIKWALFTPPFANENEFISFFSKLPEPLNQEIKVNPNTLRALIGTRSKVLRVTARGYVGRTGHQIEAVIDTKSLDYLYWREEGLDASAWRR
jgi:type II secretory pathway component PulK